MALSFYILIDASGPFLFFLIFSFLQSEYPFVHAQCDPPLSCNQTGPVIQFPFWRKGRQSDRCGIPGFELSCNNKSETIINLPFSGDFIVRDIDYLEQVILINDPDSCLLKRMQNFTLSGSRFRGFPFRRYSFFNCSSNWTYNASNTMYPPVPMLCLSSRNNTVYAVPSGIADREMGSNCVNVNGNDSVSPEWSTSEYWSSMNLEGDLQLMWHDPRCWPCISRGLICRIIDDNEVGCLNPSEKPKRGGGLPRSVKYGIIIGIGIPALLFIIGLACHTCSRIKAYNYQRRLNIEVSPTIAPQTMITITGLDGQTIESYPKTVLGESRRLPKPSDGTCPICLCEYQPKECLRTIPECNHYYHVDCIDEWLKLNGTCPLCRNSPENLSTTPNSSMSSSSSTISTPS